MKVPVTSAPNCFVERVNVMGPVFRKRLDGSFEDTGVRAEVRDDRFLHGVNFRFENVSSADARKALAKVKELIPGIKANLGVPAWVHEWGVPAVGTVGTDAFVYLGDNLVALAPVWVLLANSAWVPGQLTQAADIEKTVQGILPGRWSEVFD